MFSSRSGASSVSQSGDINATNERGETALITAIQKEDIGLVRDLLSRGADVNVAGKYGMTPLMTAVHCGSVNGREGIAFIEILIAAGANLNQISRDNSTALIRALMFYRYNVAEELFLAGASLSVGTFREDNEVVDLQGRMLELALNRKSTAIFQKLLSTTNFIQNSFLTSDKFKRLLIAGELRIELIRLYFEHNKTPATRNKPDCFERALFFKAIQSGNLDVLQLLLDNGANPNTDLNLYGKLHFNDDQTVPAHCPLVLAVKAGHLPVVNRLMSAGAKADIYSPNLLWVAIVNNHLDIAKFLIEKGENVNGVHESKTLLENAINEERFAAASMLLSSHGIVIPANLRVPKEFKMFLFNSMMAIEDLVERKTALLNAAGKGLQGKDDPVHKIMCIKTGVFFTSQYSGTLSLIDNALKGLEKISTVTVVKAGLYRVKGEASSSANISTTDSNDDEKTHGARL